MTRSEDGLPNCRVKQGSLYEERSGRNAEYLGPTYHVPALKNKFCWPAQRNMQFWWDNTGRSGRCCIERQISVVGTAKNLQIQLITRKYGRCRTTHD